MTFLWNTLLYVGFVIPNLWSTSVELHLQTSHSVSPAASVPLDARLCRPAAEKYKKDLGPEWKQFKNELIECPLKTKNAGTVLLVISVDGEKFAKSIKAGDIVPALPKALLLLPNGARIGELPYAFPFDPPVDLDVTFADWTNGWPQTVKLYVEDPAVGGNRRIPPLRWNGANKIYTSNGVKHGESINRD